MASQVITRCIFTNFEDERRCAPNIHNEDTVELVLNDTEGSVTFEGNFRIEDHAPPYPEDDALEEWERPFRHSRHLPIRLNLYVEQREKEPYCSESVPLSDLSPEMRAHGGTGWTRLLFRIYEEHHYIVEIYRRVIHTSLTSIESGATERDDAVKRQTVFFRVVETVR